MEQLSPELRITGLSIGDCITYSAHRVYFDLTVTGIDEDRGLPAVAVAARNMDTPGYPIVDKINESNIVGILLGSTDDLAEQIDEGVIVPGKPIGLEIQIEGEIETSHLLEPETPPIIRYAA